MKLSVWVSAPLVMFAMYGALDHYLSPAPLLTRAAVKFLGDTYDSDFQLDTRGTLKTSNGELCSTDFTDVTFLSTGGNGSTVSFSLPDKIMDAVLSPKGDHLYMISPHGVVWRYDLDSGKRQRIPTTLKHTGSLLPVTEDRLMILGSDTTSLVAIASGRVLWQGKDYSYTCNSNSCKSTIVYTILY